MGVSPSVIVQVPVTFSSDRVPLSPRVGVTRTLQRFVKVTRQRGLRDPGRKDWKIPNLKETRIRPGVGADYPFPVLENLLWSVGQKGLFMIYRDLRF